MVETVQVGFRDCEAKHNVKVPSVSAEVDFGELDGISENMMIGFPTLAEWGMNLDSDADGNVWVEFRKLGVTMLAEQFGAGASH